MLGCPLHADQVWELLTSRVPVVVAASIPMPLELMMLGCGKDNDYQLKQGSPRVSYF